ncbi:MAG: putative sugar nucleotidyl transferase [Planctomycetota bacterium]
MLIICYEDQHVEQLCPIVHARPAYQIGCAGHCLLDWLQISVNDMAPSDKPCELRVFTRPHLVAIQEADHGLQQVDAIGPDECVLFVNARLAPTVANLEHLKSLLGRQVESHLVSDQDPTDVMALACDSATVARYFQSTPDETRDWRGLMDSVDLSAQTPAASVAAFHWPHDVVATHMKAMADSVEYRLRAGRYEQREDGVFVAENVRIGDHAVIDTSGGAIVLESDVKVGPFCYLEGPLYAGKGTRVIEHSAIKDGVALGHTVKIGGEVEASVIEPYTNKQHHGFLGHSYLGSWINLGAGTCNSDLKNTYGKINIEYGDQKVASGMQFLGCIMGDYSKTAINTGIFTGKVVGVCSMLYGFVTSNVPSYVNYARLFGQTSLLPPEVMVNTQARMFARRKVEQRPCDIDLIHAMYERSESEREAADMVSL